MKKQTMYHRLQKQYAKLNQSIQKAMQTGRFYAYTQFKQQQLLSRLKRCSFQLKQLGAGVAVVGALGMATPAVGQVSNLIQRTGLDNPFDGLYTGQPYFRPSFVDIDGDGDLDMFQNSTALSLSTQFFRNTGTDTSANFTLVSGTNNPLDGLMGVVHCSFVDIDGDGDLDMFAGGYGPGYYADKVEYYENIGSSTMPQFTKRTGVANPLDALSSLTSSVHPFFVDIDNDGDQDCFVGTNENYSVEVLFYENIGTVLSASFLAQTGMNNPLNAFKDTISSIDATMSIQFEDMDNDGDKDAFFNVFSLNDKFSYYENTGTANNSSFTMGSISPLDSIPLLETKYTTVLVDIDNDGDTDVLESTSTLQNNSARFYENCDIKLSTNLLKSTELPSDFLVYPNPTNGTIKLEKELTGQLNVFSLTGQKVYTKELQAEQLINLSFLEAGTYLLSIQADEKHLQQTIVIQK